MFSDLAGRHKPLKERRERRKKVVRPSQISHQYAKNLPIFSRIKKFTTPPTSDESIQVEANLIIEQHWSSSSLHQLRKKKKKNNPRLGKKTPYSTRRKVKVPTEYLETVTYKKATSKQQV